MILSNTIIGCDFIGSTIIWTDSFSEQAPNVSFTQGIYSVREDEEVLTVSVERSGDSDLHVTVHITTHPSEGTATGQYILILKCKLSNYNYMSF